MDEGLWKFAAIGAVVMAIYFATRKCPVCGAATSEFIPGAEYMPPPQPLPLEQMAPGLTNIIGS